MMTRTFPLLAVLPLMLACGVNDGDGNKPFHYSVRSGENQNMPVGNAAVRVYASAEAWVGGQAPLKLFTTNAEGVVTSTDKFTPGVVVYAESGDFNNWPDFLRNPLQVDPNVPDMLSGGTQIYKSFLSSFQSASSGTFALTDARLDGVSTFASVDACSKDNTLTLRTDGMLIVSEGANVCAGATATREFRLSVPNTRNQATLYTVDVAQCFGFALDWPDAENMAYVSEDFRRVMFKKTLSSNTLVTIFTRP